jgi:hypothetical protein
MQLNDLLKLLGYTKSAFFRMAGKNPDLPTAHLLRDAQDRANVRGTYFIRTMSDGATAGRERPAVYVAEADTPDRAREIHRQLWNQGTTPFLVVWLPGQVRVYTPFAFDESDETVGRVIDSVDMSRNPREVPEELKFLRAESIDSGEIWQSHGHFLLKDKRVDRVLLEALREISRRLVEKHDVERKVAHALVGRFVYLHYLNARGILSDKWLDSVGVVRDAVFSLDVNVKAFRRLTDAVDNRFNGHIFPIDWSLPSAPSAEAVRAVGLAFAGVNMSPGEFPFHWTFDFSFIPIELLSAIYEQFLHDEGKGAKEGAFYTSEPVADYLLAEVESVKPLRPGMKVLDPCCGSGIFLVLAFRRLVEQELRKRKSSRISPSDLSQILTSSIFGVERNSEACLVTEFSLILALLSYVDPPELHRHESFKFPVLHDRQIFETDFFLDDSEFWMRSQKFDWIVGNPPWVELNPRDKSEEPAISWIRRSTKEKPVARNCSHEAFTWRATERLADGGVVGLITKAASLTNDHSAGYRKAFFTQNRVHRITNFANLAYLLFEGRAKEAAANLIYSAQELNGPKPDILHFGPLVVNQPATVPGQDRLHRAPWVLTVSESEIQIVPATEGMRGEAMTWKRALWGNPMDRRALERLRRILPTTLGDIASERKWALNLGLQLRRDAGERRGEGRAKGSKATKGREFTNQDVATVLREQGASQGEADQRARRFAVLKVLDPENLLGALHRLTLPEEWLVDNKWGVFLREGRKAGLRIVAAPHLMLWNEFAAFSDQDFILRHPDIGLAAPRKDVDWLKAVSVIWASSVACYFLFLNLNASWGIGRSTIDLGDVRGMPMPNLNPETVRQLATVHTELAAEELRLADRRGWQRRLDNAVASILSIPPQILLLAREFREFRLSLVQGKAPYDLLVRPDTQQTRKYACRLKAELDGFIEERSRHHAVTVFQSRNAIVATIELVDGDKAAVVSVQDADLTDRTVLSNILKTAEKQHGQWAYVRRSVRVFDGRKIHIIKPARRLEWTETRALLDAADIIAEVVNERGRLS